MRLFSYFKRRIVNVPYINILFVNLFKNRYLSQEIWGREIMGDAIEKQINLFVSGEKINTRYIEKLTTDIILSYLRYGAIPSEYFLFDFPNSNHKRRSSFLTVKHKDEVMVDKVGMGWNYDILDNKAMFYEKFKDYFNRDVCLVRNLEDFMSFKTFISKHPVFIAKPLNGQCGKGIRKIDIAEYKSEQMIFTQLCKEGMWICEELIVAVEEISQWHPKSLNSVRINSFINSRGFFILKPFFRCGRGNAFVDNANSGGILAVIDEKTGLIKTDGVDMCGIFYEKHPESSIVFKGFQIPQWQELLSLTEKIHRLEMPSYPYVGWDFALTERGWSLIEGNWGQFVSEYADREGIKEKFDSMFD